MPAHAPDGPLDPRGTAAGPRGGGRSRAGTRTLGLLAAASLGACGGHSAPPDLHDLQRQIVGERAALADRGVYINSTAVGRSCVRIDLVNPSRANRAYLSHRFGRVCVGTEPEGPVVACAGAVGDPTRRGPVVVPDLTGEGIAEAEKRITRLGLTYAIDCLTDHDREPAPPPAYAPEARARVTRQCPRAGERVAAGTRVALEAVAHLPGGFAYPVGTLDEYQTGTKRPCADGRNPSPTTAARIPPLSRDG